MAEENTEDPPRKGRSNAILTYEKVEELNLGLQKALLKLDVLSNKMSEFGKDHTDHEVRLRALELTMAGYAASRGSTTWAFQMIWPVATVLLAAIALFLK